jgi:hypothetical protein
MPWIDPEGNRYNDIPNRVRLEDNTTRTSSAVTEELLVSLGWSYEDRVSIPNPEVETVLIEEPTIDFSDAEFTVDSLEEETITDFSD